MISVQGLTKYYGDHKALSDLSFEIKKGEIVGLLGPNGAGKSTTMKIITGFIPATTGDVYIDNNEIYRKSIEIKKNIGYMPENIALYPDMRVKDYLKFCAAIKHVPRKQRKEKIEHAMKVVNITDRKDFIIGRLSKGYKQRVGLAQAILHDPKILILDEPTVGLDPSQIVEIRSLIKSLAGNRTVILSTHILSEVQQTCERAIIINKGTLIAEDTIEKLRQTVENNLKASNIIVSLNESKKKIDKAAKKIRTISGVGNVYLDDENNIMIESSTDEDVRPIVAQVLVNSNFKIREMRSRELTLEEIFLYLTRINN